MPTYLYFCGHHGEFEDFHSISKIHKECPKCKEEGLEPAEFKQLINMSNKGKVELYGAELADKVKADTEKLKKELYSSESKYANFVGEGRYENLQRQLDQGKKNRRR